MKITKQLSITICSLAILCFTSCNSQPKQHEKSGFEFTLVTALTYEAEPTYTFNYEGDGLTVFWGDGTINRESSHTYEEHEEGITFIICGDITSLSFCDSQGNLLSDGNASITSVVFSNTITTIPSKSFYGIERLTGVVIPDSVQTIGYAAFANLSPTIFYCAPEKKPDGWDKKWDVNASCSNIYVWGSTFLVKDDYAYVLLNNSGNYVAYAMCCLKYNTPNLKLNIPGTVSFNDKNYILRGLTSPFSDLISTVLTEVTIPNSVMEMAGPVFGECVLLNKVTFEDNSQLATIDERAFCNTAITEIAIPKSVRKIGYNAFAENRKLATVDLTGYTNAKDIAICYDYAFTNPDGPITFKYKSPLEPTDFINKGWPKEKAGVYHWELVTSLA